MKPKADIVAAVNAAQLEVVRALLREYQATLPAKCRFDDAEWQYLPGPYAPPRGTLLLATVAGAPAGCVGLRPFPSPGACEMKRLYVMPQLRGSGLGRELVMLHDSGRRTLPPIRICRAEPSRTGCDQRSFVHGAFPLKLPSLRPQSRATTSV